MTSSPAGLNRSRTFVLWGLAVVWFAEMTLWGLRPLAELWTRFWGIPSPDDPQLATALYLSHSIEAAAKGGLGVLALYALRSRSPLVRSALLVPMALVPPLNLAFQFRAMGFPLLPTLIGAALSVILWETIFLFKDREETPNPATTAGSSSTAADVARLAWFGVNAIALTLVATYFLAAPDTALRATLPGPGEPFDAARTVPSGLTLTGLAIGAHLMALAVATWVATVHARGNATVPRAVASASTLHVVLLCALPLLYVARTAGARLATSSLLIYAVPLLAGWLAHAVLSYRVVPADRLRLTRRADH